MSILFIKVPISLGIQVAVSCIILDRHYSLSSSKIACRGHNFNRGVKLVSSGSSKKGVYCSCFFARGSQVIYTLSVRWFAISVSHWRTSKLFASWSSEFLIPGLTSALPQNHRAAVWLLWDPFYSFAVTLVTISIWLYWTWPQEWWCSVLV